LKLSYRVVILVALTALVGIGATFAALRVTSGWYAYGLAFVIVLPAVLWSTWIIAAQIRELHDDLGNALRATRDGDYGLRLAVRGDVEVAELKRLYNELTDAIRTDRHAIHNKEILLDTILQRTPVAVMLINAGERVVYSNVAARELLARGARLDGHTLQEIAENLNPSVRDALHAPDDAIIGVDEETFHLTQRLFRLHTQQHRLILLERLTPELRRQEVAVWKKAIRIINHEINNTVAPISSLFHSARRAQELPEHRHRLEEIYDLIDERLQFLRAFLESYAQFARLPEPRKKRAQWSEVLDSVRTLYPFTVEGDPQLDGFFDRTQMEQVLINLVKNAHEAGSEEVTVSLQRAATDHVVSILDRGRGMPAEVMRQALVPFYTTKPGGSGLGLALCNEIVEAHGGRMRLAGREGGGTVVTLWIPAQ
jgi:nitrogen fixation/metabolism regulation signal transduction histidine kinase